MGHLQPLLAWLFCFSVTTLCVRIPGKWCLWCWARPLQQPRSRGSWTPRLDPHSSWTPWLSPMTHGPTARRGQPAQGAVPGATCSLAPRCLSVNEFTVIRKKFRCPYCSFSAMHQCILKRHMRSHTGERPYPCEICGKKFTRREHMKRHTLVSAGPAGTGSALLVLGGWSEQPTSLLTPPPLTVQEAGGHRAGARPRSFLWGPLWDTIYSSLASASASNPAWTPSLGHPGATTRSLPVAPTLLPP